MTAKNIRSKSKLNDAYTTPDWCIEQVLDIVVPEVMGDAYPPQLILDAGSGTGAFGRVIRSGFWKDACVHGFDLDSKLVAKAKDHYYFCEQVDFLAHGDADKDAHAWGLRLGRDTHLPPGKKAYDLSIGNPPYTFAVEFIDRERLLADVVIKILRHGFMGSEERSEWWQANKPHSVWNLAHRVPFTIDGKADSADYCWIAWKRNYEGQTTLHWLPTVPKAIRRPKAA